MYRPKGLVNELKPYQCCYHAFEAGAAAYEEALKAEGQYGDWWHSTGSGVYKMMNVAKTYTHKGTLCFIKDEEKSND